MIIIQELNELNALMPEIYPKDLCNFVSELFTSLQSEAEPGDEQDHLLRNPLILCEPGDSLRILLQVHSMGLEYAETIGITETLAFRVGILLDNDWLAQYIVPASIMDSETLDWLTEQAGRTPEHE